MGTSGYGNNSGAAGFADAEARVWVSRSARASLDSRNRLIRSQISWSDGVCSIFGFAGVLGVPVDPLTPGLAPGVAIAASEVVGWGGS